MKLDPNKVPVELRLLIPLAERWGIGDDAIRDELTTNATPEEQEELNRALAPHWDTITAWLDRQDEDMSDEAAAFMYMQLATEEFGIE